MHKKAVSPLIATVLLIGFSVALAAVVMTWGLDYIRGSTEEVGKTTQEALRCATQLAFEITEATCEGDVTIQNNGVLEITKFTFRIYQSNGEVNLVTEEQEIEALGVEKYNIPLAISTKIEAIATIQGDAGHSIVCRDVIKEYATNCDE